MCAKEEFGIVKNHNSIDLFKLIMAFAVVAIHTHPMEHVQNEFLITINDIIVSYAVPFYFIVSGYFLGVKMEFVRGSTKDIAIIKKQLIKISKMYLLWTLIYCPLAIYHCIKK